MTDQNGRIHNQVVELLSAYIDDEVSADERATVEAHLATCATCAQDLASLRLTVNLLGELPQVAAPRPFTVRESDVRPVSGPDRPAWWRLRWAQGLVGAAAVLLCVAVVGVVLLGRGGMMGAPSERQSVAFEAAPTTADANREGAVLEEAAEAEMIVEAEKEIESAAEPAAAPLAPEEATGELGLSQEAPAVAPLLEEKAAADEAEMPVDTSPSDRAAAGEALMPSPLPSATPSPMPTATPAPMATAAPAPAAEAIPAPSASPTPILLEAEDLNLEIQAGVVRVRGRLPLPEGRKLLAVLWRDGEPVEWATIESQRFVVEADGRFYLVLIAQAEVPDFDLSAAEPADYEIRIRPVDPPAPVEIRIPIDTSGPLAPPPTNTP